MGWSMYPVLKGQELILVETRSMKEVRLGNLLVFLDGEKPLCHRVVLKTKDSILLKGDSVWRHCETIPAAPQCKVAIGIFRGGEFISLEKSRLLRLFLSVTGLNVLRLFLRKSVFKKCKT